MSHFLAIKDTSMLPSTTTISTDKNYQSVENGFSGYLAKNTRHMNFEFSLRSEFENGAKVRNNNEIHLFYEVYFFNIQLNDSFLLN